jgi:site-specific DNA recombinase
MAGMDRENIARRTWEGRKKSAEKGRLPSGPAPYGYRREGGRLVIVEAEAEVVRRIYRLHRQGKGTKAIAKLLTQEGVPTRSGKPWNFNTVARILDQPLYHGTLDVVYGEEGLATNWGAQNIVVKADAPAIVPTSAAR